MANIPDASALPGWRKSSYSENGDGGCIEVADGHPGVMPVRDSKNPTGPAIVFPISHWGRFISAAKDGQFTI
ncbi:DUF397 domain-containing protein [Streptomyces xiamenensis]|uniref:DUF397 domain-containing protein n=1 Tax=Streptomyces xiamenensis TaxID=408015 RepID=UPI0037D80777